ncbi:MAG: glycosyltransferase family 4 protein [Candidatus Omnitrophica bacterium]|jgi:glycosyltransferase involved in cell wall biosynthesis|nr:glycosyltransferase family 4 protein [Candidatus Omnitrophota bacterium]
MKIALITPTYLPNKGGVETFLLDLVGYFNSQGHNIKVITQKYPQKSKPQEDINGIEVIRFLFFDPKLPSFTLRSILAYLYTFLLAPLNLIRFFIAIDSFNPDVISYHFPGAINYFLLFYLRLRRKKIIVSLHGADTRELPYASNISRFLLQKILKKANFITTNSHFILKEAMLIEKNINQKARVIYNGIKQDFLSNQNPYRYKERYLLSMGRLIAKKGFDILIKAFNEVLKFRNDISLFIVGEGPEKENLVRLINKLNLEDKIKLLPWSSRGQVAQYLKGCQFLVLPSRYEAFGMVIIESWLAEKPVVTRSLGGPQEIIKDGINGLLVKEETAQDLSKSMIRLLQDNQLYDNLVRNIRDMAKEFSIENTGRQYLEVFKRCE